MGKVTEDVIKNVFLMGTDDEIGKEILDEIDKSIQEKIEEEDNDDEELLTLPILPVQDIVLFQNSIIPINVVSKKATSLLNMAEQQKKRFVVITKKSKKKKNLNSDDIYKVGTIARVLKRLQNPDGTLTVLIQGFDNINVDEILTEDPYFVGKVSPVEEFEIPEADIEFDVLKSSLSSITLDLITNIKEISSTINNNKTVKKISNNFKHCRQLLLNIISTSSEINIEEKQSLLEIREIKRNSIKLLSLAQKLKNIFEIKSNIQKKTKENIDEQQKTYVLQQELKAIQDELGENFENKDIIDILIKARKKKWNKKVKKVFDKELIKLERLNPSTPDYSIQLTYIETLVNLPWNKFTKDNLDLNKAQKVLDSKHSGLEKVKERIIEYLAVLKLKGNLKSPIICLYGPPGVGKTSLGKSIAEALNRKYVKMSLGGVHDESEIRGHRKTYIGAMPGRIIKNLINVQSSNPVCVLDEIDKVGKDIKGDPESALLEVLDPEQNDKFHDNFIDVDYDLSNVLFIATANDVSNISRPLKDRMEMIEVTGYLEEEKVEIASKHLIKKQREAHGIKEDQIEIPKDILETIVEKYTAESGVRQLDRTIAKVMRQVAKNIALGKDYNTTVTKEDLHKYLGVEKRELEEYHTNSGTGIVPGLAWTSVGGCILYIESTKYKGKGLLSMTGSLGDVMKESATLAYKYLQANAEELSIPAEMFTNYDVHIHVPDGSTPKDGPSAGITISTALASTLTGKKIREKTAMTGEITLRGKVTPVGGIKEKILAAKRAGIENIILCEDNKKHIEEINEKYIEGVNFVYVDTIMDVLKYALIED